MSHTRCSPQLAAPTADGDRVLPRTASPTATTWRSPRRLLVAALLTTIAGVAAWQGTAGAVTHRTEVILEIEPSDHGHVIVDLSEPAFQRQLEQMSEAASGDIVRSPTALPLPEGLQLTVVATDPDLTEQLLDATTVYLVAAAADRAASATTERAEAAERVVQAANAELDALAAEYGVTDIAAAHQSASEVRAGYERELAMSAGEPPTRLATLHDEALIRERELGSALSRWRELDRKLTVAVESWAPIAADAAAITSAPVAPRVLSPPATTSGATDRTLAVVITASVLITALAISWALAQRRHTIETTLLAEAGDGAAPTGPNEFAAPRPYIEHAVISPPRDRS